MNLRRGQIWTISGRRPRNVLVISGGMYNDQPAMRTVLTMRIETKSSDDAWCVPVGEREFVLVDRITFTPKTLFARHLRTIDVQALTDVNNALFKILATN